MPPQSVKLKGFIDCLSEVKVIKSIALCVWLPPSALKFLFLLPLVIIYMKVFPSIFSNKKLYIISLTFLLPVASMGLETHVELKTFLLLTVAYLMVCILIEGIMDLIYV